MVGLPGETLDNALETVELNMVLKSNYVRANTFLLFPGLPLVEYAKQKGYLDKDFDMEKHVAEATEINIKTPYDREFRNVAALFWLMVKFSPRWIPFFKKVVSLPDNVAVPHHRLVQHGAGAAVLPGAADPGPALLPQHRADDPQVAAQHDDAHVAVAVQAQGGSAPSSRRSRSSKPAAATSDVHLGRGGTAQSSCCCA